MDTFENNNTPWEDENVHAPAEPMAEDIFRQSTQNPVSSTYRGEGVGRKESPYADAPHAMNYLPRNTSQYIPGGNREQHTYTERNTENPYQPKYYSQSYQPNSQLNSQPEPPKPKKKKNKGGFGRKVIAALLVIALVGGSCVATAAIVNKRWEAQNQQMTVQFNQQIQALQEQIDAASHHATGDSVSGSPVASIDGMTPGQVYARNVDAVVAVSNQMTTQYYGQTAQASSSGSGFIISEDGYVISNYHVVEGATTLTVITNDGKEHPATLKGYDSTNDLALLKIEGQGFPCVSIGSSDDLIVGDQVVAIGNPLGELTNTLTVGYVSAKDRVVSTDGTIITMIQTDAAINSGNSGGPLFNMKGEVVGITSAKYSGTTSSGASIEGIGFAIPMDDVQRIISDLKQYGYVTGAYLGVMVRNMDADTASVYRLPVGAYVDSVEQGGAAERAGIQAGDIIIKVGDTIVSSITDLTRVLRNYNAGDTGVVTVYRAGREMEISVTFDEKSQQNNTTETAPEQEATVPMPSDGDYEDWYNYFSPFFGNGYNGG